MDSHKSADLSILQLYLSKKPSQVLAKYLLALLANWALAEYLDELSINYMNDPCYLSKCMVIVNDFHFHLKINRNSNDVYIDDIEKWIVSPRY